jgi:coenzyme F420-0:L-glutamate ligase / coenzyme F420-1:gamma-L-glutamate ligase
MIQILPVHMRDEVTSGADLTGMLLAAGPALRESDVVVVSHKAVAKAEGRIADLRQVTPSERARELAGEDGDPRQIELVLRESRRIVRRRGSLLITETHHGFVCASAGIDRSNTPGQDLVVLLPVDPDRSARGLRAELERRAGVRLAVVVADTMGRPLRNGIVGAAIGAAGLEPLRAYRGRTDPNGYTLRSTWVAVADELACAADLVLGKLERVPAAVVRGYPLAGGEDGAAAELVREPERDLFL